VSCFHVKPENPLSTAYRLDYTYNPYTHQSNDSSPPWSHGKQVTWRPPCFFAIPSLSFCLPPARHFCIPICDLLDHLVTWQRWFCTPTSLCLVAHSMQPLCLSYCGQRSWTLDIARICAEGINMYLNIPASLHLSDAKPNANSSAC